MRRTNIVLTASLAASAALAGAAQAQLVTTDLNAVTPTDLVNALLGGSIAISNVTYSGAPIAAGTFSGGTGIIGFADGIILSSGNIADVIGPNTADNTTVNNPAGGDADLETLTPHVTFDSSILEFDFECESVLVISFQYVFSSEEYNEFVNTQFNDVFGFFLNGVNVALLPDNVTPVSINTINCGGPVFGNSPTNCAFYINNDLSDGGGAVNTEMDGLTVVLNVQATVNPGVNHIKLAIADASDSNLDSNVFIKGGSFVCAPVGGLLAGVDIKPGSCPNPVNRNSNGVVPAAILGSEDFNVMNIDVNSVMISRADGVGGSVGALHGPPGPGTSEEDVGTPFDGDLCGCHAANGDGYADLTLKFRTQDMVSLLELGDLPNNSLLELVISGTLSDGTEFTGNDCIRVQGPGGGANLHVVAPGGSFPMFDPFIDIVQQDLITDAGGFTTFDRSYEAGTVVTLQAQQAFEGRKFLGWRMNGSAKIVHKAPTITIPIMGAMTSLEAVYERPRNPGSSSTNLTGR
jgi:hypothetical protein